MVDTEQWTDFQKYVYGKLEKNDDTHSRLFDEIAKTATALRADCSKCSRELGERTARLEVKSTVWGFLGGIFSGVAFYFAKRGG